jgi:hypothetical protein
VKGAYLLSDGGYEKLAIFMNPKVYRNDRVAVIWAEFLESVRRPLVEVLY